MLWGLFYPPPEQKLSLPLSFFPPPNSKCAHGSCPLPSHDWNTVSQDSEANNKNGTGHRRTEAVLRGHIWEVHTLFLLHWWAVFLSRFLSEWHSQIQTCWTHMNCTGSSSGSIQGARWDAKIHWAYKCTPWRKNTVKLTSIKPQKYMLY